MSKTEPKEIHTPPKKTRPQSAQPQVPEDAEPQSPTTPPPPDRPPLSSSPPHESKVRQIRKRVRNLSRQEAKCRKSDEGSTGDLDQQEEGQEPGDVASKDKPDDDKSAKSVSTKSDSDKEEVQGADGEDPAATEFVSDFPAEAGAVFCPDELPKEAHPTAAIEPQADPRGSIQSDKEEEDRPTDITSPSSSPVLLTSGASQGKRRRDDGDENPRETKRISPPPDPDQEKDGAQDKEEEDRPTDITGLSGSPVPTPDASQGKRRRDDGDENPRETKRISPPPDPDQEKDGAQAHSVKPVSG